MIQRIQSLYLIVGAAIQALFAFGTYFSFNGNVLTGKGVFNDKGVQIDGDSKTFALGLILAGMAIISMIAFKNRKLQIKLANGAALLVIAQFVFLFLSYSNLSDYDKEALSLGYIVYLLPVSMALFVLAAKAIKKDDELVRSVDRIR